MAHEIEHVNGADSFVHANEPAWHHLGARISPAAPPRTAVELLNLLPISGLVETRRVYFRSKLHAKSAQSTERWPGLEDHRAVVRIADEKVLGLVSHEYVPIQEADAFGFMDPLVTAGDASFETCGRLKGGTVSFALLRMKEAFEVLPGDGVRSYLLAFNSHDGTTSYQTRYSCVRVVCANTLSAALSVSGEGDHVIRVRHQGQDVKARVEAAGLAQRAVYTAAKSAAEMFRAMARLSMKRTSMEEFLRELIPNPEEPAKPTRAAKARDEILRLAEEGVGSNILGVRGTLWGLYNGVTEFTDHVRGRDKSGELRDPDAHLSSLWFGAGASMKDRALAQSRKLLATV